MKVIVEVVGLRRIRGNVRFTRHLNGAEGNVAGGATDAPATLSFVTQWQC